MMVFVLGARQITRDSDNDYEIFMSSVHEAFTCPFVYLANKVEPVMSLHADAKFKHSSMQTKERKHLSL